MLEKHGSAADAAIAAMLCEGVLSPHTTGITGGFIATIYNKATNKVRSLIARDMAPLSATVDMFKDIPLDKPVDGGRAVAVPGEIKGYYELHKKHGKLPWEDLFEPVIKLARSSEVSTFLAQNLWREDVINKTKKFESLRKEFTNNKTHELFKAGETIERHKLADTLQLIADHGADTLYTENGTLAKMFVDDVHDLNGTVTLQDLAKYRVRWEKPLSLDLKDGRTLYTAPTPGSGALLIFMLNVLRDHLEKGGQNDFNSYHRIAEAFKFAYAKRGDIADAKFQCAEDDFKTDVNRALDLLEDQEFADDIWKKIANHSQTSEDLAYYDTKSYAVKDSGTANMNIIAPNGDAIAVTATINTL